METGPAYRAVRAGVSFVAAAGILAAGLHSIEGAQAEGTTFKTAANAFIDPDALNADVQVWKIAQTQEWDLPVPAAAETIPPISNVPDQATKDMAALAISDCLFDIKGERATDCVSVEIPHTIYEIKAENDAAQKAADDKEKADRIAANNKKKVSRGGPRVSGEGVWGALAQCESSGNPAARSAGGLYKGAFQFGDATWKSLGYEGSASDYPYAVQLEAAKRLKDRSGWSQWPRCSKRLGLR